MTKAPLWGNHRPADVERARDWVEAVVTVSAPHYDRIDIATEQPMTTGIFRSGASFGGDQFFELNGRIASALS